jgi:DNA polymerase III delta prime subunit
MISTTTTPPSSTSIATEVSMSTSTAPPASHPSPATESETFIAKYKPYYLHDFCMNEKMMSVLQTLLEIDDLNVLFVGASGSGKTTLLYSLIREYYGFSRTSGIPETNILFINNLKEQGIHYYRNEMKTFCQSHCSIYGKKKLIVIDDLDTINEQSQQVFRNYIDKYKHNINFISVCTNIQKVIESIQSRVHIVQLSPPSETDIINIMNYIISRENLVITDEAKAYLLIISNHSLRVLINYLEKIFIYGKEVDVETCKSLCSTIPVKIFENYIEYLKGGDLSSAIQVLYDVYDQGYSVIDILDYLYTFVKITDLLTEETKYKMIPYLCKYITIFNKLHENIIELAFFSNNVYTDVFVRLST